MKRIFSHLLLTSCFSLTFAQGTDPVPYANSIKQSDAKAILNYLASDSLEGRDTGSKGQHMASDFIVSKFQEWGLEPVVETTEGTSYFQKVPLDKSMITHGVITSNGKTFTHLQEMVIYSNKPAQGPQLQELVFVGAGQAKDYDELDVTGKAVLIWGKNREIFNQVSEAWARGAAMCFVVFNKTESGFNGFRKMMSQYLGNPQMRLSSGEEERNLIIISPESAAALLGQKEKKIKKVLGASKDAKGNPNRKIKAVPIEYLVETDGGRVDTHNILGYLKGAEFPNEVLVITAHYDHVGRQGNDIFNGADDNGSGTTALLEIAEAFALAAKEGYRPKRSILFMPVTAEEKGLLGSEYYSDNPIFPLENTVVNLNMDMVGHLDDEHDHPNFVCVIGSDWLSSELHEVHERANNTYVGLELDYTYNSKDHPERFYYRSDQYNFAKHNIPVIFYTSGDHEDYHQPTDVVENIAFERIEKVARLVFHTAWELANRDTRIVVDKTLEE